jgi:hypothetical protein
MPTTKRISAGSLATLLGVDIKTVHGWTDAGLLTQPEHTLGGHRRYDPAAVAKDYTRAGKALPERFATSTARCNSRPPGSAPSLAPQPKICAPSSRAVKSAEPPNTITSFRTRGTQ